MLSSGLLELIIKNATTLLLPFVIAGLTLWATSDVTRWGFQKTKRSREFMPFMVWTLIVAGVLIAIFGAITFFAEGIDTQEVTVQDVGTQITSNVTHYDDEAQVVEGSAGKWQLGDYWTQTRPPVGDSITIYCYESSDTCWMNGGLQVGSKVLNLNWTTSIFVFLGGLLMASAAVRVARWNYVRDY